MALIDIKYGSLASSDTMNKNFIYLDDKIADTTESIMTSISSILSNIATINSRLNEISDGMDDSIEKISSTLEEYKTKTKILVNKASMVPDWKNTSAIAVSPNVIYTASSNGYVLMFAKTNASGNLTISNKVVPLKRNDSPYDNNTQLMVIPVCENDEISSDVALDNIYFVPKVDVSLEDF